MAEGASLLRKYMLSFMVMEILNQEDFYLIMKMILNKRKYQKRVYFEDLLDFINILDE